MSNNKAQAAFVALNIAVVTVSDTRTEENDTSGGYLQKELTSAGHRLAEKHICKDDVYRLRALIANLVADTSIHAILVTGGTGFTRRDNTVVAIKPLFDSSIDGFGELFRALSYQEIGSSTIQSRAFAGLSNGTVVFCMPGSTGACKTAWEGVIAEQLNSQHSPCNFVGRITGH
ncbi:MAG: molybdenum cofactor biosynthesis protein B [SAR86 cluster bacterium]|uniref:Molybdenum cofactor biosynthesis protein B n=1 Tax=SAR86 cluster bacterium TaxID=2030880 RepID=A0A2A5CCD8_9GAMM|nr:molybdenum cofactor biosynthesis protein B [Gammaproteobacteria bacterium AH-315-E17]PCJ41433.1 MAG: molybdenum cofactor biosynthesis protein B [SAR86 cluster bacterium]